MEERRRHIYMEEKMKGARELSSAPSSSLWETGGDGRRLSPEDPRAMWPRAVGNAKRRLSKQLSMRETARDAAWERRRRQILRRQGRISQPLPSPTTFDGCAEEEEEVVEDDVGISCPAPGKLLSTARSLTDEDLEELRGSIELGFRFSEEDGGHDLCDTLPALDLYFAVNRQLSDPKLRSSPSPASTPTVNGGGSSSSFVDTPSPRSPAHLCAAGGASAAESPPWKIFSPGDSPKQVKTRLRHWAQVVAFSVLLKEWDGGEGEGDGDGAAAAGDGL